MKNKKVTIFLHTLSLGVVPGEQRDMGMIMINNGGSVVCGC